MYVLFSPKFLFSFSTNIDFDLQDEQDENEGTVEMVFTNIRDVSIYI